MRREKKKKKSKITHFVPNSLAWHTKTNYLLFSLKLITFFLLLTIRALCFVSSNSLFYILNTFTHISIYFFTVTYIKTTKILPSNLVTKPAQHTRERIVAKIMAKFVLLLDF